MREEESREIADDAFGVLVLRVHPRGAALRIDGESWPSSDLEDPLSIHLASGEHELEVSAPGHETFATSVQIRGGQETRLNVKLPTRNDAAVGVSPSVEEGSPLAGTTLLAGSYSAQLFWRDFIDQDD